MRDAICIILVPAALISAPPKRSALKHIEYPSFPPSALASQLTGIVRAQITVGKNGVPSKIAIEPDNSLFANSVISAAKKWRFYRAGKYTYFVNFIIRSSPMSTESKSYAFFTPPNKITIDSLPLESPPEIRKPIDMLDP